MLDIRLSRRTKPAIGVGLRHRLVVLLVPPVAGPCDVHNPPTTSTLVVLLVLNNVT
jgi:hypothetical protein